MPRRSRIPVGDRTTSPEQLTELGAGLLPGHLGVEFTELEGGIVRGRLQLEEHHYAPNGFVHAGAVVTLADTAAGYGCVLQLPEGATGFTTLELKVSFLRAAREGLLRCEASPVHVGRTTQVWDAEVTDDAGRTIAVFRCTQLVLYARGAGG